jgi:periplasmic protein TonB
MWDICYNNCAMYDGVHWSIFGEDTAMSTTAFEIRGPNKALFRSAAIMGSALIWGTVGYLALTYVPKIEKRTERPEITIVSTPDRPIVIPPPVIDPPKRPEPPVQQADSRVDTAPTMPTITTRTPRSDRPNPLAGELPAGPAPISPAIDSGILSSGPITIAPEPVIIAPPVVVPIPEVIAPPVPKLVENPVRVAGANPTYPNRALDRGIMGEVTLSFTVTPSGKVENLTVIGEAPSGYGFARAARDAIQGWTFRPQTIDGIPVAYPARYTISFKLED